MRVHPIFSRVSAAFLGAYERLFKSGELALRDGVVAESPWRNRHKISGSEFPTAPILPRYQY